MERSRARGERLAPSLAATVSWIPLLLLFFRMPPVVYSLAVVRLPGAIETALYAPAVLFVAAFAALAFVAFVRARREAQVAKGYPPSPSLGEGRSP